MLGPVRPYPNFRKSGKPAVLPRRLMYVNYPWHVLIRFCRMTASPSHWIDSWKINTFCTISILVMSNTRTQKHSVLIALQSIHIVRIHAYSSQIHTLSLDPDAEHGLAYLSKMPRQHQRSQGRSSLWYKTTCRILWHSGYICNMFVCRSNHYSLLFTQES